MNPPRRVGLFGGTFDPPHLAHVALAHTALEALALAEVRWLPAGQPWQKAAPGGRTVTPAAHRVAMVRLAAAGEPRFTVDTLEVEQPGPSYTLHTVQTLSAREPGTAWVLVIGQDQYANLATWHGWRELLAIVTLAVAARPGVVREAAAPVRAMAHEVVPLPMMDISATTVRARVAAGLDISQLVPAQVAGYIAEHGLYRGAPSPAEPLAASNASATTKPRVTPSPPPRS